MRPEARIAAAIDILDDIFRGAPAERCLTNWARAHRFAGSGDRAAIRDLVFDALRCRRSFAWQGGGETGRAVMLGSLRAAGRDPAEVFTGYGHAPAVLCASEEGAHRALSGAPQAVRLDCQDWLLPLFHKAYGKEAGPILRALQTRASVFLRVNTAKATRADAQRKLADEGIETAPHSLSETALVVTSNPRRVRNAHAYTSGVVELQDAASQAVVDMCRGFFGAGAVLDYCAGGGGKALALAAAGAAHVTAHDADPGRMNDIPARASRAGVKIAQVRQVTGQFDLVLCDAPCSGSGAWRRQPEAKWRLTFEALDSLNAVQDSILDTARMHVKPGGALAYATCSLLPQENDLRVAAFMAHHPEWRLEMRNQWTPLHGGDGFFLAILRSG